MSQQVRFPFLLPEGCLQHYDATRREVSEFQPRNQSAWYSHAHALVRLAKLAYAIGNPLAESREWLQKSLGAFQELFSLRGQTFYTRTRYRAGKPLPEERIVEDGYTSVDSFNAALVSLVVQDLAAARSLVQLAGHSPGAELVSPKSEVCNSNQQTLSHALNALIADDMELASREACKLTVRRGTQLEKQTAAIISAIASNGDVLAELNALLFYHEKEAQRRENWTYAPYYLCLPALGLANLAVHFGRLEHSELDPGNLYAPAGLLRDV